MTTQPYTIASLLKASLVMPLLLSVVVFILMLVTDDYISSEDWDFISIIMLFFSGATCVMSLLFVFPLLCWLRCFVAIHFFHIILLTCVAGIALGCAYEFFSFKRKETYYFVAMMVGTAYGLVSGSVFCFVLALDAHHQKE